MVQSYTTFFGKPSRMMMRMCESLRMIIDFCTSNHLITLIMPAGPDVTSWLNATLTLYWASTSQASAFSPFLLVKINRGNFYR